MEEQQRAERLHSAKNKKSFIIAHEKLRLILADYLDQKPQEICILTTKTGKPFLDKHPLHFNLSHSKDWGLLALSLDNPVGVDIEALRDNVDHNKISQRFFSTEETSTLNKLPTVEKWEYFFSLWTQKEAYLKAKGEGLSGNLNYSIKEIKDYTIQDVTAPEGYKAALATKKHSYKTILIK